MRLKTCCKIDRMERGGCNKLLQECFITACSLKKIRPVFLFVFTCNFITRMFQIHDEYYLNNRSYRNSPIHG